MREKGKMKGKQNRILTGIAAALVLVTAVVMYAVHRAVPFMMDDLWYATLLSEDTPVRTVSDIFKSQIWHYFNWGGRSMTHSILQLTLLAGESAADVLNVGVTFLLALLICTVAGNKRLPAFFAACGMLPALNANWKMSMFWQSGAANYLYITVFLLAFLYCYLRELADTGGFGKNAQPFLQEGIKPLPGIGVWIVPLGILAGWSNENMGPAVWLSSLFVMVLLFRENKRIKPWMVLGSLSCLFGWVMMIAAPGNYVRSAQTQEDQYGLLWRCFLRGYAQSKAALEYLFPALLVVCAMLLLARALKLKLGRRNVILLGCALLSWGAMILSPHYPDRACFGTMVLLICVALRIGGRIARERKDMAIPLFAASVLVWLRGMYFLGEFLAISWGWIR